MASQEPLISLEVIQLNTKTWTLDITGIDGNPLPLYGYTVFFTVKSSLIDEDAQAKISKTIICPNDANSTAGKAFISLNNSDTNVAVGNYIYDITLQKVEGSVITFRRSIATGSFRVNLTVTKRTS